ncbi:DNA-binding protein [Blastococcus sp. TF02-8]|uniref:DNA-binding protein n=1 Tax=Blastococcus sp. TF02-8 TaxID=2250574 RepID=UPI000DE9DFE5|nr:DNA-binding protein [Blastococcus sp. TF02-8]RBY93800.1 DNA-binding protein [Blastococcus sp. TF02-8]
MSLVVVAPRDDDQARAAREADARNALLGAGADALPRPPWARGAQPPAASELVRFALWRAAGGSLDEDGVLAALALLPAVRAEADELEAGVLLSARAAGLSWSRISAALGLSSPQAAQQRFDRVTGRLDGRS